ncbi:trypsin-like serine peptidase [Micromonospora sp. NPDC048830]|uniref:trypsin-like serine peptidase n=1 Tax=Micromonospora sp. NPDC048830 TaxID=3364257 RepID=UPI00371CB9CD
MPRKLPRGLAVVAMAALVTLAAPNAVHAGPAPGNGSAVSGVAELSPEVARTVTGAGAEARQRALAEYWTPARMRAARPESEIPAVRAARAARQPAQGVTRPQGPAGAIAPAAPADEPRAAGPAGASPTLYYPNYPVGHPVARTIGRVFFTLNGGNYTCVATIVNTEGKSSVWTAAHCLTGGGAWATNWAFVPNYSSGSAPYGIWYATQLWATNAFFNNNSDFANDVGSAVLGRVNGWRICDYLGGQGIAWNYPIGQYVYAFGYDGAGRLVAENGPTYDGGGGTIYMVNSMTGTSSGGPWLINFDGSWGQINGHSDFKYNTLPQYMFSPYYGNQVASLYNAVRNISS